MDKINAQQVVIAIERLIAEGEVPTSRKIRVKLGNTGSTSTILKFFNQWKNSQAQPESSMASTFDPSVVIAINKQISIKVDEAMRETTQEIAELHNDNHDLIEENGKQRDLLEDQAIEMSNITGTNSELHGQLIQLQSKIKAITAELDAERKAHEDSKIALALTKQRLETLPSLEADVAKLGAALLESKTQAAADCATAGIAKAELEAEISHLQSIAIIKEEQAARELNVVIEKLNVARSDDKKYQKDSDQVRAWMTAQIRNNAHSPKKTAKRSTQA